MFQPSITQSKYRLHYKHLIWVISPVAKPHILMNLALKYVQSFLMILYLQDVLFQNLNDATMSSLGNLHNM